MDVIKKSLPSGIHMALSVSTVMCFIQFLSSLFGIFRTGVFDSNTLNNLLSSFDGFESVMLFIVIVVLKNKEQ